MNNHVITVKSELPDVFGDKAEFVLTIDEDGKTKAIAFFDIDETLAHLEFIHEKAIAELFSGNDSRELIETYRAGFRLGNSFREFDRMYGIYCEGKNEWEDPEVYRKDRLILHQSEIDTPKNEAHERAAEYARRYSAAAAMVAQQEYIKSPERFGEAKTRPIFELAASYKQLGIPMVGLTANGREFVLALGKYIGLFDLFIDIATDEDMAGGGKEIAIKNVMSRLEAKGIPISSDRLIIVGDSLRGDIGSGVRLNDPKVHVVGVLVVADRDELALAKKQIAEDPELKNIANRVKLRIVLTDEISNEASQFPMRP